ELVSKYMDGVAASSMNEARSSAENYNGEMHTYCPAYEEDSFEELMSYSSHVVFNSHQDLARFAPMVPDNVKIDIRLNLQNDEMENDVFQGYNPNKPFSRFGITAAEFRPEDIEKYNVTGIHFHALWSQGAADLKSCVETLEKKFPGALTKVKRLNMGGGHLVCRPDYDYDQLANIVKDLKSRYDLEVYIEPSEHVYAGVGVLKARVLSVIKNEVPIAILNVSAKNHMPDVLESDEYNVEVQEGQFGRDLDKYTYILGGNTCLSGDVIGDYSFPQELKVGDTLTFIDQTAYTLVQCHHFNGVAQPDLIVLDTKGNIKLERKDSYERYLTTVA
ncbi:MAG: carboxynorspermidine decarboxylase, partial [Alphaproteobacteria bacterium]|nr:carboxynorspermidine decarboxylase [Alphaproteobacteria bacterium]